MNRMSQRPLLIIGALWASGGVILGTTFGNLIYELGGAPAVLVAGCAYLGVLLWLCSGAQRHSP